MKIKAMLEDAYKELFEIRPVSWGGHMSPLFPKEVKREPSETVVFKSINKEEKKND